MGSTGTTIRHFTSGIIHHLQIDKRFVNPPFSTLSLWVDPTPREGPQQMACDEILLHKATTPVLRIFRWSRPWMSIGYFMKASAAGVRTDLPFCRRWTGGGVVVHENDFTFALIVPRGEVWGSQRAAETYLSLHQALATALRQIGQPADLAEHASGSATQCFAGPVRHDILLHGRKIAGGAQRRTRHGLLHQGSLQLSDLPPDFPRTFAHTLSTRVQAWSNADTNFAARINQLTREKYAHPDFLHRERS